jgi:hypothetical protein
MLSHMHADLDEATRALRLPDWVGAASEADDPDALSFAAGAALACLHPLASGNAPQMSMGLLRDRLAMRAAVAAMTLLGRSEREAELRDEVYLLRAGERPGQGGAALVAWRRTVATPLARRIGGRSSIASVFDDPTPADDGGRSSSTVPLAQAAAALERAMRDAPHDPVSAMIAADAALARALRWSHVLPLLGLRLRRADLARAGSSLQRACARAVVGAANDALRAASEVARARARLMAVAPRLRARSADAAITVFLSQAAVAPSLDLAPRVRGSSVAMTDRAARRLCERLVSMGVARELTGRAWSRLYGL